MKKSWGLTRKILSGQKTCEERWYKTKRPPFGIAKAGDIIYFKDSGEPVSIKAKITKVLQFDNLTPEKSAEIASKYAKADLGTDEIPSAIKDYTSHKNYCVIIFFDEVEQIAPFAIDKTGFGAMSAWLCVSDINKIKKR
ncbi:MAG: ASCH domain-containing protein [Patescibacteria group bacterium]